MRKYVFLGCASFLGAVARYGAERIQIIGYHGNIPINTLAINVSGALWMAFLLTLAFEVWAWDEDIRLGVTTGFLGAYTTFSTLCKESVTLLYQGAYASALLYMTSSVIMGLAAVYAGVGLARAMGRKIRKASAPEGIQKNEEEYSE